jgi:hypothetical protein
MDDPFRQARDPRVRADRYQKMACEFFELAKSATSPFLRASFRHTAEEYRIRARGELRALAREGALTDQGVGSARYS